MAKAVFTSFEAARYCGVSPYTVRNWVEAGKLPAYTTPGGHRRVRRADLDAFLEANGMPAAGDLAAGCKRILIAERAGEAAERLRRFVQGLSERLEVYLASDGFGVAWAIHTFRPHLLLMSLDLSRLDGLRVIRSAKACPETSSCHILAMTVRPTVESVEAALLAGALECLVKPLDQDALRKTLRGYFPSAIPRRSPTPPG